ncbi:MAG: hypothetical protein US35_C0033G0001 [Parcubacteria group bacterium GW2011_GWA2_37_10]|nr:MAG: hypothetical protein US35_C0033G0001 [Parcubacteria group bacterium GW2011_GWA2_37_10]
MAETKDLKMYFNEEIAASFAELEQNEKNFRVAMLLDRTIMYEAERLKDPIYAAELGGGAHQDRYHALFRHLLKTQ